MSKNFINSKETMHNITHKNVPSSTNHVSNVSTVIGNYVFATKYANKTYY